MKNSEFIPKSNSVLCSHHFAKDCFDRTSMVKVRLLPNAVPTIEVERLKYVSAFTELIRTCYFLKFAVPYCFLFFKLF